MKRYIIYLLTFMMPVLIVSHGVAVNSDRPFRNADLEKYKGDVNGVIIPETTPPAPVKKEKTAKKKKDEKSKQYWCSRGSATKAKVDRSKANVEAAEQKLADLADQPRKKKSCSAAEKKVRSAKKELYRAEQELNDLERTALRQSIPPGWLNCQFSY